MSICALEMGGTNTGVAFVDPDGTYCGLNSIPTPKTLGELKSFLKQAIGGHSCKGIGVSVAATVRGNNIIQNSPNIPMLVKDLNLAELIQQWVNLPTYIFNDAITSATGVFSIDKRKSSFWSIILGTGYGGKLVIDKTIISDSEPGHVIIDTSPYALPCGCGQYGCGETRISGKAIEWELRLMESNGKIKIPNGQDPGEFYSESSQRMDPWAVEFDKRLAIKWAHSFLQLMTTIKVNTFVFKGGCAEAHLDRLRPQIIYWMSKLEGGRGWCDPYNLSLEMSPNPKMDSYIGAAVLCGQLI